ncbi:hypothetical protein EMCRGX_G000390 [Ephydatia muelleri]
MSKDNFEEYLARTFPDDDKRSTSGVIHRKLDNGREFINHVIQELIDQWHSNIQLVSGRPRHPQSHGVVERAHATLERKLSAEISNGKTKITPPWAKLLPKVIYSMNTQVHDTTGRSPYELVFGQMPREVVFPSSTKSAIILEDLEADGVVLDSVDCHNSAISSKCTNDSEEPCQEGNICIGENPDVSKCDDDDDDDGDGEPECLQKDDDDDQHDEASGVSEDDEGVVTDVDDIGDEKEVDTNSDGLVLRRSKHLAITKKHIQVRQAADIKYLTAAQRMANRYNRKKWVKSFGVGDKVSTTETSSISRSVEMDLDMERLKVYGQILRSNAYHLVSTLIPVDGLKGLVAHYSG